MILFLYNLVLLAACALFVPLSVVRPRWRDGLRERLGEGASRVARMQSGRQQVWVHAVSVGEVVAITRLVEELDARLGQGAVVISTTTRTGQQMARERFGATRCFYFPLDLPWVVRDAVRVLRPRLLVLAESELWPNLLQELHSERVPVAIVNARVSDRSLPRYLRLKRMWRPFLSMLSLVQAQSEEDARRFVAIGVPAERVEVGGNLKYDARPPRSAPLVEQMRQKLAADARVLVAGSTLEDEECVLLDAWPSIAARVPGAVLVLAPRRPERFAHVAALVRERRLPLIERSRWAGEAIAQGSVFLLDTIGELGAVYGLAAVAFVGGSLTDAGGHNPLEPARCSVPVVMGPHVENFRSVAETLRAAGALRIVTRAEVGEVLGSLLTDAEAARAMGLRGQAVFAEQAGATERALRAVLALMTEGEP